MLVARMRISRGLDGLWAAPKLGGFCTLRFYFWPAIRTVLSATKKYALACSECKCECNCECSATRLTHFGACHAAATTVRNLNKLWKNALLCASLALFPQLAFRLSGFGSHTNCCCCPSFFFMTLISFQFRRPNLCKSYSQWWYFNCVRTVIRTVGVCWFWFSFFGGYMRCSLWFVMHWRELSPEVSIIAYIS